MSASLHWLPSHFRIQLKFILFNFKFQFKLTHPTPLSSYTPYAPTHSLWSADHLLLIVWKRQGNLRGDQALAVAAPKLWKLLPQHIRHAPSLSHYKPFLKTHLFSLAFDTYWNVAIILFEMQFKSGVLCCFVFFKCLFKFKKKKFFKTLFVVYPFFHFSTLVNCSCFKCAVLIKEDWIEVTWFDRWVMSHIFQIFWG